MTAEQALIAAWIWVVMLHARNMVDMWIEHRKRQQVHANWLRWQAWQKTQTERKRIYR